MSFNIKTVSRSKPFALCVELRMTRSLSSPSGCRPSTRRSAPCPPPRRSSPPPCRWTRCSRRRGDLAHGPEFDALVDAYARPGAFSASVAWYRGNMSYAAGAPIDVPTTMLWGGGDPLFPVEWADGVGEWFTDYELRIVSGAGHFLPLEDPKAFAAAIVDRLRAGE